MTTTFGSNSRILSLVFALLFLAFSALPVAAQIDLNAQNLSSVRSSDISDDQLKSYLSRAQSQGISIEQALQLAVTRGLPASEAQEIRSRIMNLQDEVAVTSAEDLGRLQQQIATDTTSVNLPQNDEPDRPNVFGAQLFSRSGINFTPSLNIPTPVNYQLGAGDELIVTIWGDRTDRLQLTVSPEGTVSLQNRGPVYVNGLTIEQARERLMGQLVQLYSGLRSSGGQATTFAEISLGRVRTINVTVTGEVRNPGSYAINALATVFNALYNSGGPNDIGSFRNIRVIRNNEVAVEFDLYNFLLYGNQSSNIRLRDQDVIQVMPFVSRVSIEGQILRPAQYELKGSETYQDLVNMAGGFTSEAYTRQIQIRRYTDTQRRIVTVPMELYSDFVLLNGDRIDVPEILDRYENRVSLAGAIWRPGEYELKEGMTLSQLIAEADGVRPDAFMSRGLINRVKPDLSFEQVSFNVEDVITNPAQYDILLQREDEVIIRGVRDLRDEAIVEIDGAVREAGVYVWLENMTLQDLVLKANGFRDSAELSRIEIARRANDTNISGKLVESIIVTLDGNLSSAQTQLERVVLQPYDVVFVHRRPDFQVQQFVTLEGEVKYPGRYAIISQNERLSDIIARAGGLTNLAYVPGARITRQRSSIDRAQVDYGFLDESEMMDSLATTEMTEETTSRIGIDLEAALRNPNSRENLYIREGDVVRIPQIAQTVRVSGAVMQEVEVRYVPGANYSYYINRAGGLSPRALKKRSYVVYANGDVDRSRKFLWMTVDRPDIEPGAEIVVPLKPERREITAQESISIMSMVVGMTTTLLIAIDRLSR
jgi:protein involved in polysaccharide export with SLBB domain